MGYLFSSNGFTTLLQLEHNGELSGGIHTSEPSPYLCASLFLSTSARCGILTPAQNISMLVSIQKFTCKGRLKWWDLDYDNMLHLLGITWLSTCRQYLNLVLLYKVVNGQTYFPL